MLKGYIIYIIYVCGTGLVIWMGWDGLEISVSTFFMSTALLC